MNKWQDFNRVAIIYLLLVHDEFAFIKGFMQYLSFVCTKNDALKNGVRDEALVTSSIINKQTLSEQKTNTKYVNNEVCNL